MISFSSQYRYFEFDDIRISLISQELLIIFPTHQNCCCSSPPASKSKPCSRYKDPLKPLSLLRATAYSYAVRRLVVVCLSSIVRCLWVTDILWLSLSDTPSFKRNCKTLGLLFQGAFYL